MTGSRRRAKCTTAADKRACTSSGVTRLLVRTACAAVVAIGLAAAAPATVWGGKFNKVLSPGDAAPEFASLPAADDREYAFEDFAAAKVLVLLFTSNPCPVSQAYDERILNLVAEHSAPDASSEPMVRLVAVSVGLSEADGLEAMRKHARDRGYTFPYLHDATQDTGRAYGVFVTPTVFVLDQDRKVRYYGAIDDKWNDAAGVKHRYLRDAIDALLAGDEPPVAETRAKGCDITYQEP